MRPLEVAVQVEEEEEEDKFVLNLPDGTSHRQVSTVVLILCVQKVVTHFI